MEMSNICERVCQRLTRERAYSPVLTQIHWAGLSEDLSIQIFSRQHSRSGLPSYLIVHIYSLESNHAFPPKGQGLRYVLAYNIKCYAICLTPAGVDESRWELTNLTGKREFAWEFSQLACPGQTRTRVAWELMKVEKREFAWEFSQLSCPGQTRTRVTWELMRVDLILPRAWQKLSSTLIKIWTSPKLVRVHGSRRGLAVKRAQELVVVLTETTDIQKWRNRAFALIPQGLTQQKPWRPCWCFRQNNLIKIILNWNTNMAAVTSRGSYSFVKQVYICAC
jgi:hypothetical protein